MSIEFPPEARGWIVLHNSGLTADQRAIVVAKNSGELKFDSVVTSMRSCFPDYVVPARSKRQAAALLVDAPEMEEEAPLPSAGDDVVFEEVEAFLADFGTQPASEEAEAEFEESETAEILAATWREKRNEISRLKKGRNFRQAAKVQVQFKEDVHQLKQRTRCNKCHRMGHWARECLKGQGKGKSTSSSDKPTTSGAAMVEEPEAGKSEVLLVSSPGYGIIDSGCGKTLIGQETLNSLFRLYQERGIQLPSLRRQPHVFAFGNNKEEETEFVVDLN